MEMFDLAVVAKKRREQGLTLSDMAENLGFSNASVYYKYEKGDYKFNADVVPKLASALHCDISDFFVRDVSNLEMLHFKSQEAKST